MDPPLQGPEPHPRIIIRHTRERKNSAAGAPRAEPAHLARTRRLLIWALSIIMRNLETAKVHALPAYTLPLPGLTCLSSWNRSTTLTTQYTLAMSPANAVIHDLFHASQLPSHADARDDVTSQAAALNTISRSSPPPPTAIAWTPLYNPVLSHIYIRDLKVCHPPFSLSFSFSYGYTGVGSGSRVHCSSLG